MGSNNLVERGGDVGSLVPAQSLPFQLIEKVPDVDHITRLEQWQARTSDGGDFRREGRNKRTSTSADG